MSLEEQHDSKSESKGQRSESPVSISTSYEHADPSEEPDGENKKLRAKTERAASPTPSYLSLKSNFSMDPPTNFKGGEAFPLDLRLKLQRPDSPTPSYLSLRTDWSMDLPTNFKGREALDTRIEEQSITSPVPSIISETSNDPIAIGHFSKGFTTMLKIGSERAPSPTLSSVSEFTDWSLEQPTSSSAEAAFHLDARLLTENHLKCPVCKSMLKDPVSLQCGHNFCRDCINTIWDSCAEEYVCPQCGKGSKTRPELNTNIALAEVVKNLQHAGFSPALPPSSYAGPEDVACDFCSERRLKAVKSCSTCNVFLCETHIKQHYTIPALQKHTLCDVTGDMEKKLAQQQKDNNISSIINGEQGEKDSSISEPVLNTSMTETKCPNETAEISTAQTEDDTDITNASNLKQLCCTSQQKVLDLKKSDTSEYKENDEVDFEESHDDAEWLGNDDVDNYDDVDHYDHVDNFDDVDNYDHVDNFDDVANYDHVDNFDDVDNYDQVDHYDDVANYDHVDNFDDVDNYDQVDHYDDVDNYAGNFGDYEDFND